MRIYEFVNRKEGIYGLDGIPFEPRDLLLIEEPHPVYTPVSATLTGATVLSEFTTDELGSVTNFTTRELTASDIGAVNISDINNAVRVIYVNPADLSGTGSLASQVVEYINSNILVQSTLLISKINFVIGVDPMYGFTYEFAFPLS